MSLRAVKLAPAVGARTSVPVLALSDYTDAAARLLVAWKERGEQTAIHAMAELLWRVVDEVDRVVGVDVVIAVPPNRAAALRRGGDPLRQALEAQGASRATRVVAGALRRKRSSDQVGLTEGQRVANAARGFVAGSARVQPEERALLLDDVITTGATVVSCGQCLRAAGWSLAALAAPFARRFD